MGFITIKSPYGRGCYVFFQTSYANLSWKVVVQGVKQAIYKYRLILHRRLTNHVYFGKSLVFPYNTFAPLNLVGFLM